MSNDKVREAFWGYLHTVTFANEGQPNEPHRQVIFKQEIPELVFALRQLMLECVPKKQDTWGAAGDPLKMDRIGFNDCIDEITVNINKLFGEE